MAKNSLIASPMLILLSSLLIPSTISSQPPVITDTLYVGQIAWGPRDADPVAAYDTISCELLFNVYETLISMGTLVTYSGFAYAVHEQYWEFSPNLATNVPTREDMRKILPRASVPPDPLTGHSRMVHSALRGLTITNQEFLMSMTLSTLLKLMDHIAHGYLNPPLPLQRTHTSGEDDIFSTCALTRLSALLMKQGM